MVPGLNFWEDSFGEQAVCIFCPSTQEVSRGQAVQCCSMFEGSVGGNKNLPSHSRFSDKNESVNQVTLVFMINNNINI